MSCISYPNLADILGLSNTIRIHHIGSLVPVPTTGTSVIGMWSMFKTSKSCLKMPVLSTRIYVNGVQYSTIPRLKICSLTRTVRFKKVLLRSMAAHSVHQTVLSQVRVESLLNRFDKSLRLVHGGK